MVFFKDYTSPSKLKYLIVGTKDSEVETKLLVQDPLVGRYADPWPQLRNTLHRTNWTSEEDHKSNRASKVLYLEKPNLQGTNVASTLSNLGRRIIQERLRWGDKIVFEGEYRCIPGYWEWTEDVLSKNEQGLTNAGLRDAVFASLFTYDRNSNIIQAFCEAWCPQTNTLLTTVGETSISLWDLHTLGGLPISGCPYEEVVPDATELTGYNVKKEKFIPQTCEYLFAAFHHLKGKTNDKIGVLFSEWIQFWCKKDIKYKLAPLRKEKKTRRLSSTYNPSGEISTEVNAWSSSQEMAFSKLGVQHQKYETYLAAFLTCWLCAFVFPSEEGDLIRPETFKMASLMANGRRISLAVPVLASIYRGLNKISNSSQLDHIKICFPIHYVYGWLAHYFKTHYPLAGGPSLPQMVIYSGEGAAKYFDKDEARKRVHRGESLVWNATMLSRPHPTRYLDDNKVSELESSYFMSLRFNYLPLRRENYFFIEPYSPHRFSRQFGFYQDNPGYLEKDIRAESLDEGLRYWRICISRSTMSKATFPPAVTSAKKLYSTRYLSWWERSHGKFLEDNLEALVAKAGPNFITSLEGQDQDIEEDLSQDKTLLVSQPQSLKNKSSKVSKKGVVRTSDGVEGHRLIFSSGKRALQEKSASGDLCWKRSRTRTNEVEAVDLEVVEVQSIGSPSKTLVIQSEEANDVERPMESPHEKPQISDESIATSKYEAKSTSIVERDQETLSTSHNQASKELTPNPNGIPRASSNPNEAKSVFEGKSVVSSHKKKYILGLWEEICGKLSRTSPDSISSYKEDIYEILKEMDDMHLIDLSPLKHLVDSLFELATSYDQEHSNFVDKVREEKKLELLSKAREHLESLRAEEGEKAKHVSSKRKSLKKVMRKLATLQAEREGLEAVVDTAKKEIEEVQAKILAAENEVSSYDNMNLLTTEDSTHLEHKRESLKDSCQDLINYRLYLE